MTWRELRSAPGEGREGHSDDGRCENKGSIRVGHGPIRCGTERDRQISVVTAHVPLTAHDSHRAG